MKNITLEEIITYKADINIAKNNENLTDLSLAHKIFDLLKSENIVDSDFEITSARDTDGNPCIRIFSTLPDDEGLYSRFRITIKDGFKSRFEEIENNKSTKQKKKT